MSSPEHVFRPREVHAPVDKTGSLQSGQPASETPKPDIISENPISSEQKPTVSASARLGLTQVKFRELEEGDAEKEMKQTEEHIRKLNEEIENRINNLGKGVEEALNQRLEKFWKKTP